MCAGAVACLPRSVTIETLLCALELAVRGEVVFPASVARAILSCAQPEQEPQPILTDVSGDNGNSNNAVFSMSAERMGRLSSREIEILKRLVAGDSNKQISRQLDISETTVKVHVKAILRKVRVRNRTQAAIWGIARLPNLAGRSASTLSDVSPRIATEASSVPKAILPIVANVQP
jgi:two-component system nitrate/nitrite response regulator NarL